MPKGEGHRRDLKKKPSASLKEKRQKKREKKMRQFETEHNVNQIID